MLEAMAAPETGEAFVILLTVDHADLADPLYFSTDPTTRQSDTPLVYKTVSRGRDYIYVPMEIVLPDEKTDAPPAAQIRISNVGRDMVELLRSITSPPSVVMEVILASDPDEVAISYPAFDLVQSEGDESSIRFTLSIDALVTEPFPAGSFNPSGFPSLF